MSIEALQHIDVSSIVDQIQQDIPGTQLEPNKDFSGWLTNEINDLNNKINDSDRLVTGLADKNK